MANKYRGEIDASLDGTVYTLCLTLGALAELETAFGSDDMLSLAKRFGDGRISAVDCTRIIGAGLRGAGHVVSDETVARMRGDDGAVGFVDVVARLLAATFGGPVASSIEAAATRGIAGVMAKAEAPEPAAGPVIPLASMPPASPRPFPGPR